MSTDFVEEVTVEDDAAAVSALAAFHRGLNRERPQPSEAAAEIVEDRAVAAEPAEAKTEDDELAALSPALRARFDELDALKAAAAQVPMLEQKWRSAEGRVAALKQQVPPPAPPKMEQYERVQQELPEVADAIREFYESRQPQKVEIQDDPEAPPSILTQEAPDWEQKVIGMPFQQWIAAQDPSYRQKVENTRSEAVMLAAITLFDADTKHNTERLAVAQKAAQTRQARVAAAVVPMGSGRREPTTGRTAEDAFQDGLRRKHRL